MKLEITNIRKCLHSIISQKDGVWDSDRQISSIADECSSVRDRIQQTIYKIKGRRNKLFFIRQHQRELTTLCNLAHLSLSETGKTHPYTGNDVKDILLWELGRGILNILEYLKFHFKKYFDNASTVPYALICILKDNIGNHRKNIRTFMEKEEIEQTLISLVHDYLGLERRIDNDFTWQDIAYLENFISALNEAALSGGQGKEIMERQLIGRLFYLNFNHSAFYEYLAEKIKQRVEVKETFKERKRELLDILRLYQGLPVRRTRICNPGLPGIRSAITSHIKLEIDYVRHVQQLHSPTFPGNRGRSSSPFYFKVSLTVAQLVFFVRLLVETGTVIAENKADLNEFLVNHVGTLNKINISERSIRSKSTNPDPQTVKNVKHALISMLNQINEKYSHFPQNLKMKAKVDRNLKPDV